MGIFRRFKRVGKAVLGLFKGRRRVAKKVARRRGGRGGGKGHHQTGALTVKKTVIDPRIIVNNATTSFGVDTFELADLPQYQAYIALYEEYRIDKIVYSFKSLNNIATGVATTAGVTAFTSLGMIHSRVDTNDAVAPTSIQDMMNDTTYRGSRSSKNHTRVIYPMFLNDVGGNTADQSKRGWLNCYNADGVTISSVSHYAMKWAFEGGIGIANQPSFVVEPIVTYYVSFRNPK